ncbi:hypothetical protein [Francisella tularensis]|uniref:hypothetical protein n=1 Tax=Francisella tularensis TaxID=263 RepID=UPI001C0EA549|nr:hypothetical protein [Francisella tularensis]MBK2110280.1 hypothetical protein [Francisella tularensis subsp. novicida FSC595]
MSSIEFENQNDIVKEKLFSNEKDTFDTFKDLYFLSHNLSIYTHFIYVRMTSSNRIINNYSQFFIYESCMRHLTIGLGMLFTKKDSSKKATGCAFLSGIFKLVENIDNMGCQIFSQQLSYFINYKESFDIQKESVKELYNKKLKIYRDKRYAHLDSDFRDQTLEKVTSCEVKKILEFIDLVIEMCAYILNNKSDDKTKNIQVINGSVNDRGQLLELYNQAGNITYG